MRSSEENKLDSEKKDSSINKEKNPNPKQYKSLVKFSKSFCHACSSTSSMSSKPTRTPVHTGRASEQVGPTGTGQEFNPQQS